MVRPAPTEQGTEQAHHRARVGSLLAGSAWSQAGPLPSHRQVTGCGPWAQPLWADATAGAPRGRGQPWNGGARRGRFCSSRTPSLSVAEED